MSDTKDRAILFADLRGSTALYLKLGNSEAATLVTHSLARLGQHIAACGGHVIKTLGDGLMASFDHADASVEASIILHDAIEKMAPDADGLPARSPAIKLKVAIAWGETVEVDGDCFGDAVNVAARLLDLAGWQHAGDGLFMARERHLQALARVGTHLDGAHTLLAAQAEHLDLMAEELRLAQQALGEITGEFSADDLLGEIFSRFCIGK